MKNKHRSIANTILSFTLGAALLLTACAPAASIPAPEADPTLAAEMTRTLEDDLSTEPEDTYVAETLAPTPRSLSDLIVPLSAANNPLAIPATFAITRPNEPIKTSYTHYFITGTSDPSRPVYVNGKEIERLGSRGTFGVYVELAMGVNRFVFSQGDASTTVDITRTQPAGAAKIQAIRQSSMVPSLQAGVKAGDKLSVGCVAPSGAAVKAAFEGRSVALQQDNTEIKAGYPAVFTGKIQVSGDEIPADKTQNAGKVTYYMDYQGNKKSYSSNGDVYVAGSNSAVAMQITTYTGFVYHNPEDLSVFKEVVKAGARDYVVDQTDQFFELASGGYVSKEQSAIVTDTVHVQNTLQNASFSRQNKGEVLVFHGVRAPLYNTWIKDDAFYLQLHNTTGAPVPSLGDSALLSGCTKNETENSVTYRFPLKASLAGFDVSFDEGDTILYLRYKPSISGGSLAGVTVVLDPGHGGKDPGALGLAGTSGPAEADVNLAHAKAARDVLANAGARVILTRDSDVDMSLDDRMKVIVDSDADLFVSLHHNSIGVNVDANKVSGLEIYYHTALSKRASDAMMDSLINNLGRTRRSVNQSYFRVTLLQHSPSMLVELGFMSNPQEYERAANTQEIQQVANAIYSGVVQALQ